MSLNLELANEEVRNIVKGLKEKGFPSAIKIDDALPTLSQLQIGILSFLGDRAQKEAIASKGKEKPVKGDSWYGIREDIRKIMQAAVRSGLINIDIIQQGAVNYGAIPDPKTDWKYYILPDSNYACWNCGTEILLKKISMTVRCVEGTFAGDEDARQGQASYCPKCEEAPTGKIFKKMLTSKKGSGISETS